MGESAQEGVSLIIDTLPSCSEKKTLELNYPWIYGCGSE